MKEVTAQATKEGCEACGDCGGGGDDADGCNPTDDGNKDGREDTGGHSHGGATQKVQIALTTWAQYALVYGEALQVVRLDELRRSEGAMEYHRTPILRVSKHKSASAIHARGSEAASGDWDESAAEGAVILLLY